jgi:hypothetical protein
MSIFEGTGKSCCHRAGKLAKLTHQPAARTDGTAHLSLHINVDLVYSAQRPKAASKMALEEAFRALCAAQTPITTMCSLGDSAPLMAAARCAPQRTPSTLSAQGLNKHSAGVC